jgi:hypothetical protein
MDGIRRDGADSGKVCYASGNSGTPACFNKEEVNLLLKDAFQAFFSAAERLLPQQFARLEERYILELQRILI